LLETSYEVINRKKNIAGEEKFYTIRPYSQNMPHSTFLSGILENLH